ncbi:MAG: hypothetical protein M1824_002259 [Vezdaea acicularis]|nr:MAG: hypothetical protein M1824_002259 [Vezdaea acicularis]
MGLLREKILPIVEKFITFSSNYFQRLNILLPFTDPKTPLWLDIAHTLVLCSVLYLAPTFLERRVQRNLEHEAQEPLEPQQIDDQLRRTDTRNIRGDLDHSDLENTDEDINEQIQGAEPHAIEDLGQPGAPNRTPRVHNVGKKKAASIARKDQRRAYNEQQRVIGEAQRAREREIEAASATELAEARKRRQAVERELELKREREKEKKRAEEKKAREDEIKRRREIVDRVKEKVNGPGWVDLQRHFKDQDEAVALLRAEGLLGKVEDGVTTISTNSGFIARVEEKDIREAYQRCLIASKKNLGIITWLDIGKALEMVIRRKESGKLPAWEWKKENIKMIGDDHWPEDTPHPVLKYFKGGNES